MNSSVMMKPLNSNRLTFLILFIFLFIFLPKNLPSALFQRDPNSLSMSSQSIVGEEDAIFEVLELSRIQTLELNHLSNKYQNVLNKKISLSMLEEYPVQLSKDPQLRYFSMNELLSSITVEISKVSHQIENMILQEKLSLSSPELLSNHNHLRNLLSKSKRLSFIIIHYGEDENLNINLENFGQLGTNISNELLEIQNTVLPKMKTNLSAHLNHIQNLISQQAKVGSQMLNKDLSESEKRQLLDFKIRQANLLSELSSDQKKLLNKFMAGDGAERDTLNNKFTQLSQFISKDDRDLRDLLNTKLNDLNGQISLNERIEIERLNSRYGEALSLMTAEDKATRARLNKEYLILTSNLSPPKKELIDQIIVGDKSVRNHLDSQLLELKKAQFSKIKMLETLIARRMTGVEAFSQSNLFLKTQNHDLSLIYLSQLHRFANKLENEFKIASERLAQIEKNSEVSSDNKDIFNRAIDSWDCTSELVKNQGLTFLGIALSKNTLSHFKRACLESKTEALYGICKASLTEVCGACAGYTKPSDCPTWNQFTHKNRTDILLSLRQEIVINELIANAQHISETLYGGASCNIQCLEQVEDPKLNLVLSDLYIPGNSTGKLCGTQEWRKCGLYGNLYASLIKDPGQLSKVQSLQLEVLKSNKRITQRDDQSKKIASEKLGDLVGDLNLTVHSLNDNFESSLYELSQTSANLAAGSGDEVAQEFTSQSIKLSYLGNLRVRLQHELISAIAKSIGKSQDFTLASLNNLDQNSIKIISEQIMPLSSQLTSEVHKTLNASLLETQNLFRQKNKTFHEICPRSLEGGSQWPIHEQDSYKIIAIYYIKTLITGERFAEPNLNNIYFNLNGNNLNSILPSIFTARAYNYKIYPSAAVTSECLSAIDQWAKEIFLSKDFQRLVSENWIKNKNLERLASQLSEETKNLFKNLIILEATVLSPLKAKRSLKFEDYLEITNRLINASIANYAFQISFLDLKSHIKIQKEFSYAAGLEDYFNKNYISFISHLNKIMNGQNELRLRAQINFWNLSSKKRMSYLNGGEIFDTANEAFINEISQRAVFEGVLNKTKSKLITESSAKNHIKSLNKADYKFQPKIIAFRPLSKEHPDCFEKTAFPKLEDLGAIIEISHGASSGPALPGTNCYSGNSTNFSNNKTENLTFRIWGSGHKFIFKSKIDDESYVVDFRQPNSNSPLKKVLTGGPKLGVFEVEINNLVKQSPSEGNLLHETPVEITPVFVPDSDSDQEEKGQSVIYKRVTNSTGAGF